MALITFLFAAPRSEGVVPTTSIPLEIAPILVLAALCRESI